MTIIFEHVIKNIRKNKMRSVFIIIALALSSMVVFLNLTVRDNIIFKYENELRSRYKAFDLIITKNTEDNKIVDVNDMYFDPNSLKLGNVDVENKIEISMVPSVYEQDGETVNMTILGVNEKNAVSNGFISIIDEIKSAEKDDTQYVIINENAAEEYGFEVNDSIEILTQNGIEKVIIKAISKTSGLFEMSPEGIVIIADLEFTDSLIQTDGKLKTSTLMLDLADDSDNKEAADWIESNNGQYSAALLIDQEAINNNLANTNNILLLILLFVIVLNIYIISSNTKLILAIRMPVVGTFRSIGASKKRMNGILILENIVYGIIGATLGIILGLLLREPFSEALLPINSDGFSESTPSQSINIFYIVISFVITLAIQLITCFIRIVKTNNMQIKEIILDTLSKGVKFSVIKLISGLVFAGLSVVAYILNNNYSILYAILSFVFAVIGATLLIPALINIASVFFTFLNQLFFGSSAALGSKNLSKSKMVNSNITLITLSLAILVMIYMLSLSMTSFISGANEVYEGDIEISGMKKQAEEYEKLEDVRGIESITFRYYSLDNTINDTGNPIVVFGLNSDELGIKDLSGKAGKLNSDEALIDEYYAIKNEIKIGDEITINGSYRNKEKMKYEITGYLDSSIFTTTRNVIAVNKDEYIKSLNQIPTTIEVNTNKEFKEVKNEIMKSLIGEGINIVNIEDFLQSQKDSVDSIMLMVYIVLIISVLIGVLGLVNNQIMGFMQRKREFAVLYSVSMSKGQLRKMVFFEILNSFITGCILGFGLSVWLTKCLTSILFSIGICINAEINLSYSLMIIGGVFILLCTTIITPIRIISKLDVVAEIKYDN